MNDGLKIISAALLLPFWFGVLTGHFARHGSWSNTDPDTYIHAGLFALTAYLIYGFFQR